MVFESHSEKYLLNECISGSKEAWDVFVDRYTNLIYHTINRVLHLYDSELPYADMEDIHNSIFLSMMENNFKKLRQYQGIGNSSVSSWIMVITTNFTINHITRRKIHDSFDDQGPNKERSLADILPDGSATPLECVVSAEELSLMQELINALKSNDKLFIKYYYDDELPPEEIALVMNLTVSAVYSKKSRIIDKLKKMAKEREILQEI